MNFLKNTWYVAAWSDEIADGKLFNRKILNEPIVFFRKQNGQISAIGDRCPHRFASLHLGTLEDDCVSCPYHGLTFSSDGKCVHNPHGDGTIPRAAQVRSYVVEERYLAVWIWMGDSSLADATSIPDYSFLSEAKKTARTTGYLPTAANYELVTDNIMDLSHVDFLHSSTLGGGAISRTNAQVKQIGDTINIRWEAKNEVTPPYFRQHLSDPDSPCDLWTEVTWTAPGLMFLSFGATPSGRPSEIGYLAKALHLMTPEDETNTHYFFANSRNVRTDDAEYNANNYRVLSRIFAEEDKPMVETQQKNMGTTDFWSLRPVLIAPDVGAVQVRRALARLIQAEQSTAEAAATVSN